ncbi:MAG: hypothetical protein DRI44_07055 [Chlamydiae bacterium]|nr:MAG: hypothetical protein DRI44_07055 [Chlamydiota bacterium]
MNKIHLISIGTGVVIVIILAVFFITKDEESSVISEQPVVHLSKSVKPDNGEKATPLSDDLPTANTNSIVVITNNNEAVPVKLNDNLRLIPDEPCPVDNFDVFVDGALQAFRKNLSDKEKDEALRNVDAIGTPMIMPVIMLALEDDNSEIRSAAIDAIQSLDDPCVIPAVEKAMDDNEPIIRQDAINALLKVDDKDINDALIKAINDSDEEVRESAFEVMLFQESPTILPAAEATIQIKNPEIQSQAINILEDIPSASAIDAIINYGLLSDYDEIRKAAAESLRSITGKDLDSYDKWVDWWDKNKTSCPENLSADKWAEWWKER